MNVVVAAAPKCGCEVIGGAEVVVLGGGDSDVEEADEEGAKGGEAGAEDGDGGLGGGPDAGWDEVVCGRRGLVSRVVCWGDH